MAARITEVRDGVVDFLREQIALRDPGSAEVSAVWEIDIDDEATANRQVLVMAGPYGQVESLTKRTDLNGYWVTVWVIQAYAGEGQVPLAWVDDMVAWVQDLVYGPLNDVGVKGNPRLLATSGSSGLYCEKGPESVMTAEPEAISRLKTFWSQLDFEFREEG